MRRSIVPDKNWHLSILSKKTGYRNCARHAWSGSRCKRSNRNRQPVSGEFGLWTRATIRVRKPMTVELGYVHGAEGMRLGHGLSLLCQDTGEGSWVLPVEIAWIPPGVHPSTYGVVQIEQFVKLYGWPKDQILGVDAGYTVEPFLIPVHPAGVPILGRVTPNRCFFLPPPYRGVGRPPVRGRKIKLNDGRTLAPIDEREERQLRAAVQDTRELPDGCSFRLPSDVETIQRTAEWITLEHRCCPFLVFGLQGPREWAVVAQPDRARRRQTFSDN
jgi:hypothetical protein